MSPQRFIVSSLCIALGLAALVASINIVVDPYLLFDEPRRVAFNEVKPAVETREMLMKAYQSRRVVAKTVILGSSRTDIAFDPASAVWPDALRPVYNLSIAGGGVETGLRYLQHMIDGRPAQQVPRALVVGLDFESFLELPESREASTPRARDAVGAEAWRKRLLLDSEGARNSSYEAQRFDDYLTGLLSLDALSDSVATVLASRRPSTSPNLEVDGRTSEARFMDWTNAEGAGGLFRQKHQATIRQFASPRRVLGGLSDTGELKTVRQLLDFAQSHRMTVVLLVMPAHATRLELFDQLCYWGEYERWKRALADTVSAAVARGTDARALDFGGFEEPNREAVPTAEGGRMKWFWDPTHATKLLGEAILERTFAATGDGFGVPLIPQTIEARLEAVRSDRESYRQAQARGAARSAESHCAAGDCVAQRSCAASTPRFSMR